MIEVPTTSYAVAVPPTTTFEPSWKKLSVLQIWMFHNGSQLQTYVSWNTLCRVKITFFTVFFLSKATSIDCNHLLALCAYKVVSSITRHRLACGKGSHGVLLLMHCHSCAGASRAPAEGSGSSGA